MGEYISPSEFVALQTQYNTQSAVPLADCEAFALRWNRSVTYWARGIVSVDQVPEGQSADFIPMRSPAGVTDYSNNTIGLLDLAQRYYDTVLVPMRQEQYSNPIDALKSGLDVLRARVASPRKGTCAVVRVRISQRAVLTLAAFEALLEIENNQVSCWELSWQMQRR